MADNQLPESKDDNFLWMIVSLLDKRLNEKEVYAKFNGAVEAKFLLSYNVRQQAPKAYNELADFCGLRGVENGRIVWGYNNPECAVNAYFLRRAIIGYINSTPDKSKAAGRLFWNILKRVNIKPEKRNFMGDKAFFKESANFDKAKISFLEGIGAFLSDRDKVLGIDWVVGYRKSDTSGVYGNFIRELASYNIGTSKSDKKELAEQTVRQLFVILQKSRESNGGKLLDMAMPVIENAANNSIYLDNVSYQDDMGLLGVKGKTYKLDRDFKKDLYNRLKRSKLKISDNCKEFLLDEGTPTQKLQKRIGNVFNVLYQYDLELEKRAAFVLKQKKIIDSLIISPDIKPSSELVKDYTSLVINYAAFRPQKTDEVGVENIKEMLVKNADYLEMNVIEGTLFEPLPKSKRSINKKLVSKVAEIYAESVTTTYDEVEEFDPNFHNKMTDMFIDIVKEHNYNKSEVKELCDILSQGAGRDKLFMEMGRKIMNEYTANYKITNENKGR